MQLTWEEYVEKIKEIATLSTPTDHIQDVTSVVVTYWNMVNDVERWADRMEAQHTMQQLVKDQQDNAGEAQAETFPFKRRG